MPIENKQRRGNLYQVRTYEWASFATYPSIVCRKHPKARKLCDTPTPTGNIDLFNTPTARNSSVLQRYLWHLIVLHGTRSFVNAAATPAARGPGVWAGKSKWTSRAFLRGRLSFAFHPERFYAIGFLLPYLPQCIGIGVGIANAPQHLWLGWVGLGWVGSGWVRWS